MATKNKHAPPFTADDLRKNIHYDPDTGVVTALMPRYRVPVGTVIGSKSAGGLAARIYGFRSRLHRFIWMYMTGEWPTEVIDHINRNPYDNRWSNLRACSQAQNRCNNSRPSHNTSGTVGVLPYHRKNSECRWRAQITTRNRTVHLGVFKTFDEALAARRNMERELWGEFAPQEVGHR